MVLYANEVEKNKKLNYLRKKINYNIHVSLADSKGNPVNPLSSLHTMYSNFVVYMYIECYIELSGLSKGA